MDSSQPIPWADANALYLGACLKQLKALLRQHLGQEAAAPEAATWPAHYPALPALVTLSHRAGLRPFERDLLLICAGAELDSGFTPLFAAAHGPERAWPTFSLALAALPGASWDALSPSGALRRLGLIRLADDAQLTTARLSVDERVWRYLLGSDELDAEVARRVRVIDRSSSPAPTHAQLAGQASRAWAAACEGGEVPIVQLCGDSIASCRSVAAEVAAALGVELYQLLGGRLPREEEAREALVRRWRREVLIADRALLLDADDPAWESPEGKALCTRLLEDAPGLVLLSARERRGTGVRASLTFEVAPPSPAERRAGWLVALGVGREALPEAERPALAERLSSQFELEHRDRIAVVHRALGELEAQPDATPAARLDALWAGCRAQARAQLSGLAHRVQGDATWADLVLPEAQVASLKELERHVRHRALVMEGWGFGRRGRGDGTTALFAGSSGTGKTLAAEVLANQLSLDLWRIDLSGVVSKYIGETEKNLRSVFDAAEAGGAVLLFDEADALFGKRGEVKDSHDRYANIEVGYLLQRLESYRGLAILTTNLKDNLDGAFVRRLRFILDFPMPDRALRARMWARVIPEGAPVESLDVERLAQLNVTGATIRELALCAAFLAAEAGEPIGMAHLLEAARREYRKLQQPLSALEIRGWL